MQHKKPNTMLRRKTIVRAFCCLKSAHKQAINAVNFGIRPKNNSASGSTSQRKLRMTSELISTSLPFAPGLFSFESVTTMTSTKNRGFVASHRFRKQLAQHTTVVETALAAELSTRFVLTCGFIVDLTLVNWNGSTEWLYTSTNVSESVNSQYMRSVRWIELIVRTQL